MAVDRGLTQEKLKYYLNYDNKTGVFYRRLTVSSRALKGTIAGTMNRYGYIQIKIEKINYKAHRLAWLYVYGEWPIYGLDHINGNRADNRIYNLRDVPQTVNAQNRESHRNGKLPGTSLHKVLGKYQAYITVKGKRQFLGYFDTEKQAYAAYLTKKQQIEEV